MKKMTHEPPKSKGWLLFLVFGGIFGIFLLYQALRPVYLKSRVPELEEAWVVSRVDGESCATSDHKFVFEGTDIQLYAVLSGREKGKEGVYYYTNAGAVKINGEEIPPDRIKKWDNAWGAIRVLWFKLEPEKKAYPDISSLREITYKQSYCSGWGSTWEHSVDVTPDLIPYHKDNVGTMRFKVKCVLYWNDNQVNPFRKAESPGPETITDAGIGSEVHGVTIAGSHPDTGIYRAFFNLPYLKEPWPSAAAEEHPAERFIAAGCHDLLIAARRLSGDQGLAYTPDGRLDQYTVKLYTHLQLWADRSFREKARPGNKIPFGKRGVRPGDILAGGDAAGILLRDEGGMRVGAEFLSDDDLVITNYRDFSGESRIGDVFEDGFSIYRWKGTEGWESSDR